MNKIVSKIKYSEDYDPSVSDSDTLYIVNRNRQKLDLFFNSEVVTNFETVSELSEEFCDDKFYCLNNKSVYYKYFDPSKKESRFILICNLEIEGCSFNESGLKFVINGKSLRVLTLQDSGEFSLDDLNYILNEAASELDCQIIWENIQDGQR